MNNRRSIITLIWIFALAIFLVYFGTVIAQNVAQSNPPSFHSQSNDDRSTFDPFDTNAIHGVTNDLILPPEIPGVDRDRPPDSITNWPDLTGNHRLTNLHTIFTNQADIIIATDGRTNTAPAGTNTTRPIP